MLLFKVEMRATNMSLLYSKYWRDKFAHKIARNQYESLDRRNLPPLVKKWTFLVGPSG